MTNNRINKYACEGLLSKSMSDYLDDKLDGYHAIGIICGAPISIQNKLLRLERLRGTLEIERIENECDMETYNDNVCRCEEAIFNIKDALNTINSLPKEGAILTLKSWWYDEDCAECHGYLNHADLEPCDSFQAALETILDDIEWETEVREFSEDNNTWYEIKVWTKDEPDRPYKRSRFNYIMLNSEICYLDFTDYSDPHYRYGASAFLQASSDLNLPVPFHAGDIVSIDCFPFAPKEHVLITRVGDNNDCCCLQCAFIDSDGKINTSSVKHGHCFPGMYFSRLSPLYRMEYYDGPLEEKEEKLKLLSMDMQRYSYEERELIGNAYGYIYNRNYDYI